MRAPGILCSAYFMQHVFESGAKALKINSIEIYEKNLIEDGFIDMFGRREIGSRVKDNFNQVKKEVDLDEQIKNIKQFNGNNEFKKQGFAMTPFKYRWSNDFVIGGAQISIGRFDGSVWVSNFGVEMGQGVHTRLAQVIAGMFLDRIVRLLKKLDRNGRLLQKLDRIGRLLKKSGRDQIG